jgi:sialate O-acetylesterase
MYNTQKIVRFTLTIWMGFMTIQPVCAKVSVPSFFSDHMVIQREKPVPIWGWADPGEKVSVTFAGQTKSAVANPKGKWMVKLDAMKASTESRELTISGENTLVRKDVLVGEVWLGSGQSNMEWGMTKCKGGKEDIAQANHPHIRLLSMTNRLHHSPQRDVHKSITWHVCSPENLTKLGTKHGGGFSGTAYYFARDIHERLKVPVGVIQSAWGGTRIGPWVPEEAWAANPKFENLSKEIKAARKEYETNLLSRLGILEEWMAEAKEAKASAGRVPDFPEIPDHRFRNHHALTVLYNGMINPFVPYGMRGFIWYQGESDNGAGMEYYDYMKTLISGWRDKWGDETLPFYYVQIAPFNYKKMPSHRLPELWEAQTKSLEIPHTGMAIINDVGELNDIHPRNKKDVGKRLALLALAKTYGKISPFILGLCTRDSKREGQAIRVHFKHTGGKLSSRDGKPLDWFEIAGSDGKYLKAKAVIDGDTVVGLFTRHQRSQKRALCLEPYRRTQSHQLRWSSHLSV